MTQAEFWTIAAIIGVPMLTLFLIGYALEGRAIRREADAVEYVRWVEEGPA